MQHEGLTPGMQCRDDPGLCPEILRVRQSRAEGGTRRLKQEGGHHGNMGQPERIELMGQREDDVVMVTGQEPRALEGQPALGLEIRALRTGPVAARVVPDTGDMAVRTRLDMTAQCGRPALHEGPRGGADVGRQGMVRGVGGKGVVEDHLQRDERHRCLRTRGRRLSSECFLQYHANYPRDKRLVQ